MTFFQKYHQLYDKDFLTDLLVDNVYSTMCLENQEVAENKVREIVLELIKDYESKGFQFSPDQHHE